MSRLIGTKEFYKRTMAVAIPIMIQNGITNFVNMLDNIMIGRIGTDQMSGVSIVNQLLFVWFLCVFGGLSGIGIFTAQLHGKGDRDGVRYTMRLMVSGALLLVACGLLVFWFGGDTLIKLYLTEDASGADAATTLLHAKDYLRVMRFCFLPFALTQVYYSTLRATGETMLPMKAGLIAVFVNLAGNYILIYGKCGAPALGVRGAAIATILSRCTELCFVALSAHRNKTRFPFLEGVFRSLHVPFDLTKKCVTKAIPLLMNEFLWAGGQAVLLQSYSLRGLSVIAAFNIAHTIDNVFNISFIALGNAIAILMGQTLGAGKMKEAEENAGQYLFFSFALCVCVGLVMLPFASVFPQIYNTTDDVRLLAASVIRVFALFMPVYAFAAACYFLMRSGGKTFITFLFDSVFCWACSIPLAFLLVRFTSLHVVPIFVAVQVAEMVKCVIGFVMVKRGVWIQNITSYQDD